MKTLAITLIFNILTLFDCLSQVSSKLPLFFESPIMTDSSSTLFIPIRYNNELLTSNKIAFWGDYYANIMVYNFQTDTYKKLFDKDAYIQPLRSPHNYAMPDQMKNITSKSVFILSKVFDYNNSGRIDEKDPSTLFVTSLNGESLKQSS